MNEYRLLSVGEKIEKGDQWICCNDDHEYSWEEAGKHDIGDIIDCEENVVRRKIDGLVAVPKEFVEAVERLLHEIDYGVDPVIGVDEMEYVESIKRFKTAKEKTVTLLAQMKKDG